MPDEATNPEGDAVREPSVLRSLAVTNLLSVANTLLRSGSALVLMPLLVSGLGLEEYGLWLTVTVATSCLCLTEGGVGQAVVNRVGQAFTLGRLGRVSEVLATAHLLYWGVILFVFVVTAAALGGLPVARWLLAEEDLGHGPLLTRALLVSVGLALVRIPYLVFPGLLVGVRKTALRTKWELASTCASALVTGLAALGGAGLVGVLVANNLAMLAMALAVGLSSSRVGSWARLRPGAFRGPLLKPLLGNSGCFFAINVSTVLDRSVAVLLTPRFASLAAAPGLFLVTSVLRVAAFTGISSLARSSHPFVMKWVVEQDHARLAEAARLMTKLSAVTAAAIASAFLFASEPFVDRWVGEGAGPGVAVTACVATAFLCDSISAASVQFLIAMNRAGTLSGVLAGKAMANLGLALAGAVLFPDPLLGIAAGGAVAAMLACLGVVVIAPDRLGVSHREYAEHYLLRPGLLGAASIAAPVWISPAAAASGPRLLALAMLSAIVALALGWLGVLDRRDRTKLRSLLSRGRAMLRKRVSADGEDHSPPSERTPPRLAA